MKTASGGVVPLSWAPMDSQGYQDLRQYKEPSATADQLGRLRTMFALAFSRHTTCIASSDPSRPLGVAHIPSTSGLRPGEHPGPPPSFGPVAVRVVGFRLMGALPSVVDGCEVAER